MAGTGVALGVTLLGKILPLFIVIPLFFNLHNFDFIPKFNFDVTQFAYLLALGVISVASFIEFQIARAEQRGIAGFNIGSALGILLTIVGLSFVVFVVATDYGYNDNTVNQWISTYMGIAIFVLGVQAIREVTRARKTIKNFGPNLGI